MIPFDISIAAKSSGYSLLFSEIKWSAKIEFLSHLLGSDIDSIDIDEMMICLIKELLADVMKKNCSPKISWFLVILLSQAMGFLLGFDCACALHILRMIWWYLSIYRLQWNLVDIHLSLLNEWSAKIDFLFHLFGSDIDGIDIDEMSNFKAEKILADMMKKNCSHEISSFSVILLFQAMSSQLDVNCAWAHWNVKLIHLNSEGNCISVGIFFYYDECSFHWIYDDSQIKF